jgi:hypothetical protein
MKLFTATRKLKKFFLQLQMFDVCHLAMVRRTPYVCSVTRVAHIEHLQLSKISFLVAVNNSIKVGPLVFLL